MKKQLYFQFQKHYKGCIDNKLGQQVHEHYLETDKKKPASDNLKPYLRK